MLKFLNVKFTLITDTDMRQVLMHKQSYLTLAVLELAQCLVFLVYSC